MLCLTAACAACLPRPRRHTVLGVDQSAVMFRPEIEDKSDLIATAGGDVDLAGIRCCRSHPAPACPASRTACRVPPRLPQQLPSYSVCVMDPWRDLLCLQQLEWRDAGLLAVRSDTASLLKAEHLALLRAWCSASADAASPHMMLAACSDLASLMTLLSTAVPGRHCHLCRRLLERRPRQDG